MKTTKRAHGKKKGRVETIVRFPTDEEIRASITIEFLVPVEEWRPSGFSQQVAFSRVWDALMLLAAKQDVAKLA